MFLWWFSRYNVCCFFTEWFDMQHGSSEVFWLKSVRPSWIFHISTNYFIRTNACQVTTLTKKCSFRGLAEVLYIFAAIGNPISLTWSLIARDMFNVSRTIEGDVTRLARNVPLVVLKKCCFFSEWFYIQHDNRPVLWLAKTFLTYFPKLSY